MPAPPAPTSAPPVLLPSPLPELVTMAWFRTGTCNNGLVPAVALVQTTSGDGSAQHPYSTTGTADSNTTRYKTIAGGATVTLTCTPEAKAAGNNGTGVTVSYTAAISPVTISLTGQNLTTDQALCGQQITASLICPSATVTGYHWAVAGNLIKTYNPSFGSGQVVALSSDAGDFNGSHLYFYDVNNNDNATATCYANITLPDGTAQVVSATSPTVTFLKPTAIWTVKEGYIQPFTASQYPGYTLFGLAAEPSSAATYPEGEDWYPVDIMMPSGFSPAGQCGFTQLATPDRTFTRAGTTTGGPKPQGLDNTFGFGSWKLPGQGNSGDNPSILTSSATNSGLTVNDQNYASDKFTTYLMYMPPAVGSQGTIWVSLQSYNWSATTTIAWNGSQWKIVPAMSSPNSPSAATVKGSPVDTLPTWNAIYVNSQ